MFFAKTLMTKIDNPCDIKELFARCGRDDYPLSVYEYLFDYLGEQAYCGDSEIPMVDFDLLGFCYEVESLDVGEYNNANPNSKVHTLDELVEAIVEDGAIIYGSCPETNTVYGAFLVA